MMMGENEQNSKKLSLSAARGTVGTQKSWGRTQVWGMSELELFVDQDQIIVNMPDTRLTMTWKASPEPPWLVELPFWTHDDRSAGVSLNEFREMALQVATKKARELGWIPHVTLRPQSSELVATG
jgi:hypothetical protein